MEAKLEQGQVLKKLIESINELVNDATFDCSSNGISLQAMDTSHVSLVNMMLKEEAFVHYRCDRNVALGMNVTSMSKILKCASNDDSITLKASDEPDTATFCFESKDKDRYSEFELKLVNIEGDTLGIPDTEYQTEIKMPSSEFQRICRDLSSIGDTVTISATKEGVKFSVSGDIGSGSITVRQNASADSKDESTIINIEEPVNLTFALKYLNIFCKSTSLATSVTLSLSKENPLLVSYQFHDHGYIRFYLAPKIDDEEKVEDDE